MENVIVRDESTPNPNARRYMVNRSVQDEPRGRFFTRSEESDDPLVQALFALEGVSSVMFLPNSITVSKTASTSWDAIDPAARRAIEGFFG